MKLYIIYHPQSDHSRIVEEYAHDFEHIKGHKIELLSLETQEGATMAKLHDVLRYPAILVTKDDHELVKFWQGTPFPRMDEVAGYII